MTTVLETIGLEKRFGGIVATQNFDFKLAQGARHALIGPNGAGKTTFVNLLTGTLAPTAGTVLLDGRDITRLGTHARVRRGLVRTFQINQLFLNMTPLDTIALAVAEHAGQGSTWWNPAGRAPQTAGEIAAIAERFHLADVLDQRVGGLPYGKQRLLEIAAAFAARPRVLLLDEPAAGVPESERHDILAAVAALPRDVAVLLIEHDMDLVFSFAEAITVMVNGAHFANGTVQEIAADPRVRAVYLGEGNGGPGHG